MIVAYAGEGGHHFSVYPKGGVITFVVSTKEGSCVFVRCFAGSYQPPTSRNNERSFIFQNFGSVRKGQTNIFFLSLRSFKKKKKKSTAHVYKMYMFHPFHLKFNPCFRQNPV